MKVIKVNKRRGNIVLSRKAILDVENAEKKKQTLAELEEGKILRGVVKNLTEYGAFIDLGGIDGLLHITDISWGRINHPSEKFQIGDELDVIVLKFDREKERVSLGFKQLQDDPWEFAPTSTRPQAADPRQGGQPHRLRRLRRGRRGHRGLIHVSEMSWTKRSSTPRSCSTTVGDWVECVVLDIDRDARRLSLGLKQTEPNPWDLIASKYRVGDRITGQVRNITDFGAFIEVEEGIDGLVHISDLSWTKRIKHPSELLNKGDDVEAVILKIDSENQRLSLGIKQLQPNAVEGFFQTHGTWRRAAGQDHPFDRVRRVRRAVRGSRGSGARLRAFHRAYREARGQLPGRPGGTGQDHQDGSRREEGRVCRSRPRSTSPISRRCRPTSRDSPVTAAPRWAT